MAVFEEILYSPPSLLMKAMSVINLIFLMNFGLSEARGKHLQYSKFWNTSNSSEDQQQKSKVEKKEQVRVSSRIGMLLLYAPAFLAGAISFLIFPNHDFRFMLVDSALTLHFLKRVLEVLFVHRYSGGMAIDSVIPISLSYFVSTASMIYNQHLLQGIPEPPIDLKYPGVILFSVAILGNFYHHYLLSKLRKKDDKGYKIPKGGLFGIIICPHYLFEILIFVGVSLISQSLYPLSFTIGTAMYLTGRSYATRKWYVSKFPNFPNNVKALIPFVF